MSTPTERTQYASSILVSQKPIDATEIVRVRLSQAKLLNDEFSKFFTDYYSIKAQYLDKLNQLVHRSEDLNRNIERTMIEKNVLTAEELQHYNLDAIGHLSEIWDKVIAEIKDEVVANNTLKNVVEQDVIKPLSQFTTHNKQWSEVRNLHSKLSEVAKTIEFSQEKLEKYDGAAKHQDKAHKYQAQLESSNGTWDAQAPFVFEAFETTDLNRLNFLKDSLLRFITAYTDSLNKISASNEKTLDTILNFNPEVEIARFAKVSSETQYVPKEARRAAESPVVKSPSKTIPSFVAGTPSKTKPRQASVATTATGASMATPDKKEKKRTKLKSKFGSVFHKKDKKNKLKLDSTLPESETSSLNESATRAPAGARRDSRTSSFMSSSGGLRSQVTGNQSSSNLAATTASPAKEPSPLAHQVPAPAPAPVEKSVTPVEAPLSLAQAPLKPVSRASSSNNVANGHATQYSVNSFSEQSSHINSPVDGSFPAPQPAATPDAFTESRDEYPTTLAPTSQQHRAPPPPPARKSGTLTNIHEDAPAYTFEEQQHTSSHGTAPKPPVSRRDIQSGLFTNLNATDLENNQNKRISSFNSFAGSVQQLRPQMTGSSISGSGMFNHPDMTQPGLNASIAEVINAKFKDGEQTYGQVIGEIALNYTSDGFDVPSRTSLLIRDAEAWDKTIPNNQFVKQIDTEEFEVTPTAILGRTLGAIKYSVKDAPAPVVVLPAWRFEPHQASVMLTLKLTPEIAERLQPTERVVLEDLVVAVSIKGQSKSALSKPQGTFNKDKSRITWKFKEPVTLGAGTDTKLIARFMTDVEAQESESGVMVKFTVNNDTGADVLTTKLQLSSQDFSEDDPFANADWLDVPTVRTLVAGSYTGV